MDAYRWIIFQDKSPDESGEVFSFSHQEKTAITSFGLSFKIISLTLLLFVAFGQIPPHRLGLAINYQVLVAVVFGFALIAACALWYYGKASQARVKFLQQIRQANLGREMSLGQDALFISAGELIRGGQESEPRALVDLAKSERATYLKIPYSNVKSFFLVDNLLKLIPTDVSQREVHIQVGDLSKDFAVILKFKKALSAYVPLNRPS